MNFNSFDNNFGLNYSGDYKPDDNYVVQNKDDYVSTKKNRIKYNFTTPDTQQDQEKFQENFSTKHDINIFYQICNFRNPNTKKFHLRKYSVNRKNEFVYHDGMPYKEYLLNKAQHKKFHKTNRPHQFKRYNLDTLERIKQPSYFDISTAKSDMLATDSEYTGYAPF